MRRIVVAPSFDRELLQISTYVEDEFGIHAADELEEKIRKLALVLAETPRIGTKAHGYATELFGFVLSPNWIFYRFTDADIVFLHIRDGRRDKRRQMFS